MAAPDAGFAAYVPDPGGRRSPVPAVVAETTEDEVPALAALQARARGGPADAWADRIHRARRAERSLVVTAKVDGEAVAYANVAFLPEHPGDHAPAGYYLTGVTVDGAWRRRGIATRLTRWRMDWVRERDSALWCFVSAGNPASLDLHADVGFERVLSGPSFQGIGFAGGKGWLLRAELPPS